MDTTVLTFPLDELPVGTDTFGPVVIADDASSYVVSYGISSFLDPSSTLSATVEVSLDDGDTWLGNGGASREGGVGHDRQGNVITVATLSSDLFMGFDADDNPTSDLNQVVTEALDRQLKLIVTVEGSPITVGPGSVVVSSPG